MNRQMMTVVLEIPEPGIQQILLAVRVIRIAIDAPKSVAMLTTVRCSGSVKRTMSAILTPDFCLLTPS
jgi:hypothetical protein